MDVGIGSTRVRAQNFTDHAMIFNWRFYRYVIAILGIAALLWLGGLFLFVASVENMQEPIIDQSLASTDAIIVLTGGSERLTTGLELLKAKKAKKLFISGVFPGLTLDHLLGSQSVPKELRSCCIILGHVAESTIGNADETATWMALENYHSLRLVTANYHMPRSLLLFHADMPELLIIPHPVAPDSVKLRSWWERRGTASLLVTEYNKYLIAIIHLRLAGA